MCWNPISHPKERSLNSTPTSPVHIPWLVDVWCLLVTFPIEFLKCGAFSERQESLIRKRNMFSAPQVSDG